MREFLQKYFEALKRTDHHWLRHAIGALLVAGGLLGFLPVLGYWMLPLGLALLAVDFPIARRLYRQLVVRTGRLRQRWAGVPRHTRKRLGIPGASDDP